MLLYIKKKPIDLNCDEMKIKDMVMMVYSTSLIEKKNHMRKIKIFNLKIWMYLKNTLKILD